MATPSPCTVAACALDRTWTSSTATISQDVAITKPPPWTATLRCPPGARGVSGRSVADSAALVGGVGE